MRYRDRLSPWANLALGAHIWFVARLIPLLDRLLTLERMLVLLTPRRPFRAYAGAGADQIAAAVRRRLERPRHMRRRTCLRLSLALYHFLRLAGFAAVFHVAVFPPSVDPKRLHAHCWVTVDADCLCPPSDEGAIEMFTYGADRQARACPASASSA